MKIKRQGLTIAEVLISTLITGLILVGAARLVGSAIDSRMRIEQVHIGNILAQELLAEVVQAPYEDLDEPGGMGLESGESTSTRSTWDDVDDYDGWSSTPPQNKSGTDHTGFDEWTREVTIQYADPDNPSANSATDQGLKRISITITSPDGESTVLVGFRSSSGSLEQAPTGSGTETVVTWIGCRLQIGADSAPAVTGVNLLNHTFDE